MHKQGRAMRKADSRRQGKQSTTKQASMVRQEKRTKQDGTCKAVVKGNSSTDTQNDQSTTTTQGTHCDGN